MIDIFIVGIYLIALLAIGIWQRAKRSGFKDFARVRDDTKKNKLILVATIFAASIGGGTTFGIAEKAFSGNVAHSYGLFLSIFIDILIAAYIVPRLAKYYGAETVGDIIAIHYGNSGKVITGVAAIITSIGFLAAQISVSGRIFEYILQVNYLYGVLISYSIVIVYSTIGGLRSVLFANQLQFFAILVAIPLITILGIYKIGPQDFINQVPAEKVWFNNNYDLVATTISAFLGFAVMNLFPNFVQRAMINSDANATKRAIYIKSAIYAVFLVLITINGLIAFILFPYEKSSLALPILINDITPVGIQGIVIVGLLAAVMSTADSDLNVTTVALVKDIFEPIFGLHNQNKLLLVARFANILLGSLAIFISLCFESVVDLVIFISGLWGPVVLVPLIFALYDRVIPKTMMLVSAFFGTFAFFAWEAYYSSPTSLKGVFIGTMVSFFIFVITYIFCNKER